jgi:hypothetical protein
VPIHVPCAAASVLRNVAVVVAATMIPVCEPLRPPADAVIDWAPGVRRVALKVPLSLIHI